MQVLFVHVNVTFWQATLMSNLSRLICTRSWKIDPKASLVRVIATEHETLQYVLWVGDSIVVHGYFNWFLFPSAQNLYVPQSKYSEISPCELGKFNKLDKWEMKCWYITIIPEQTMIKFPFLVLNDILPIPFDICEFLICKCTKFSITFVCKCHVLKNFRV